MTIDNWILILLGTNCVLVTVVIILIAAQSSKRSAKETQQAEAITSAISEKLQTVISGQEQRQRDEARGQRQEIAENGKSLRAEIQQQMASLAEGNSQRFKEIGALQKEQLDVFGQMLNRRLSDTSEGQKQLTETLENRQAELRNKLDEKLSELRRENTQKLDEMRQTVDEKLQSTLEKRLGESFKIVSDRLEKVHQGLGEMQNLASNVGDLRRTLTNVKTRGTWAEIQLSNILSDMLTSEQYIENAQVKPNSMERVEFAIKLPGKDEDGSPVLLPIDSKFPTEDYERLVSASESGDPAAVDAAVTALSKRISGSAKEICDKYISPPATTDFAIMYLPTEGLYAEVLRRPGLVSDLQNKYRVIVTSPSTISAFLNSLQMGFKTLAIKKRSSEVWQVLGAVKQEFSQFGDVLSKVKKKLQEAGNHIDKVEVRSRAISRKLKTVEELPYDDATTLLGTIELPNVDDE